MHSIALMPTSIPFDPAWFVLSDVGSQIIRYVQSIISEYSQHDCPTLRSHSSKLINIYHHRRYWGYVVERFNESISAVHENYLKLSSNQTASARTVEYSSWADYDRCIYECFQKIWESFSSETFLFEWQNIDALFRSASGSFSS